VQLSAEVPVIAELAQLNPLIIISCVVPLELGFADPEPLEPAASICVVPHPDTPSDSMLIRENAATPTRPFLVRRPRLS
jgi:hypothetical protein